MYKCDYSGYCLEVRIAITSSFGVGVDFTTNGSWDEHVKM